MLQWNNEKSGSSSLPPAGCWEPAGTAQARTEVATDEPTRLAQDLCPEVPVSCQLEDRIGIRAEDFEQSGLYLFLPRGERIVLTREKIEAFVNAFESNLDQLSVEIRGAVSFQACPTCLKKDRAKFCHALPATLAFLEELKGLRSFDHVSAVYRGYDQGLVFVPKTTMQEALQFVVILSLMFYCEVGKKYWRYFQGIHPLLSPKELISRIYLNIHWDCRGDERKIDEVLRSFGNEIECTCRCQVRRLGLVCKNDALMNAFVNTQAQIELLVITKDALLEESFEEFMKNG